MRFDFDVLAPLPVRTRSWPFLRSGLTDCGEVGKFVNSATPSQYAIVQVGSRANAIAIGDNAGMTKFLLFVMAERPRGAARTPFGPWVIAMSGLPA